MDLVYQDGGHLNNDTKSSEKFLFAAFLSVSSGSANFLGLNLNLPLDIRNF